MRILIHRGAEEIGGNCIQLEANGKSLLLDLGAPLSGRLNGLEALPKIKGLRTGDNPDLIRNRYFTPSRRSFWTGAIC